MSFENISSIGLKSGLYGGSGKTLAPARSIASNTAGDQVRTQVVEDHHIPATQGRHQDLLHVRRNVAALTAPANASGARTPSSPSAAITVTDSHDAGAEASTRSPAGPGRRRASSPS